MRFSRWSRPVYSFLDFPRPMSLSLSLSLVNSSSRPDNNTVFRFFRPCLLISREDSSQETSISPDVIDHIDSLLTRLMRLNSFRLIGGLRRSLGLCKLFYAALPPSLGSHWESLITLIISSSVQQPVVTTDYLHTTISASLATSSSSTTTLAALLLQLTHTIQGCYASISSLPPRYPGQR